MSSVGKNSPPQQRLIVVDGPANRPQYASLPGGIGRAVAAADVSALYVHVPFCSTKCHYCDFYSVAGHLDRADDFLGALKVEIGLWQEQLGTIAPETIFIGGGTPTLLDPGRLEKLLSLVRASIDTSRLVEFSVEANPNTFDEARAAALVRQGVNRVSMGAQSFIKQELRTLERDHDPENVARALEIARNAGIGNLNVDLIFGIPGQTLETWEYSLSKALALAPEHMSCYSLIYEPNTAMTARMKRGDFAPIDEDLELAMFEHVYRRLREAGYRRYEVSNYAKAGGNGRECRHNIHYWKGSQWLAWGPSAAGHLGGYRWKNVGSLSHYLEALLAPSPETAVPGLVPVLPLTQVEHLSPRAWAGEVAAFWLRLAEGLNYAEFLDRTGVDARPVMQRVMPRYVDLGLVQLLPERACLTEKAVAVSNRILADVLAAFAT